MTNSEDADSKDTGSALDSDRSPCEGQDDTDAGLDSTAEETSDQRTGADTSACDDAVAAEDLDSGKGADTTGGMTDDFEAAAESSEGTSGVTETGEEVAGPERERTDDRADSAGEQDGQPTPDTQGASDADEDDIDYDFAALDRERLPPDIQYTPEFDDDWIYPSGAKAGGRRDDVPVQGLELGVVAHVDQLGATVEAVLGGLTTYYEQADSYPRHRIVADRASFEALTDGNVGIAATIQPRADSHDGLVDHMQAMKADPDEGTLTPNRETALRVAAHLATALAEHDAVAAGEEFIVNVAAQETWEHCRQVANTAILERYAPLAAGNLYDPLVGEVDLDGPGVEDVTALSYKPSYLDVPDSETLRTALNTETTADGSAGEISPDNGPE